MTATRAPANTKFLISTKLHRPRRSSDAVLRPRLIDKLNEGLERNLTLISAPAGYGKTTLLLTWLETCPWPSVWLSLDEQDNFFPRFCSYVLAAIRARYPQACTATQELVQEQQYASPEEVAGSLVNELAAIGESFIFVFDDYHLLHDTDSQQFMRTLIKSKPPQLHIALATRVDPALPLPRLRANHDLTEVRVRDLQFTTTEAKAFFERAVNEPVDDTVVAGITQRTEGWTVGLRLAAISMQAGHSGSAILRDFNEGSSDFVTDYLMREVLEQQPAAMQRFLLRSSILDRFCPSLCDAVCFGDLENGGAEPLNPPHDESAYEYLDRIKRLNLFLTSLDTEQNWFRYHYLLVENLRYRLRASVTPEQIAVLHRRASRWFAEHGDLEDALDHALAGGDTTRAVQLVEAQCQNLLNPIDRSVLEQRLSRLPDELIWNSPRLLVARGWILFRQWNMPALDTVLDRMTFLLQSADLVSDFRHLLQGQLATLRSVTLWSRHHDYERAAEASEAGLASGNRLDRDTRGLAVMAHAMSLYALGQRDRAIGQLSETIEDLSPHAPSKTQSYLTLALLHRMAGDLTRAQDVVERMSAYVKRSASVNAEAAVNYVSGLVKYERNELEAAETHFSRTLALRNRSNFLGGVMCGLGLVRIRQRQERYDEAEELISLLRREHVETENYYLLPLVETAQAYQSLLQGDRDTALRWARTAQYDVLQDGAFHFQVPTLTQARILLRHGTRTELQNLKEAMQQQLALLEAYHFTNWVIQTLAMSALVNQALGDADDALLQLRRALELGYSGGFVRTFLDSGETLAPLLQRVHAQGIVPEYTAQLLAAIEGHERGAAPATQQPPSDSSAEAGLLEPLTYREIEILRLIGRGLSNQEIADQLVISPHTVKTHATNIYAKLSVSSRARAIHKARQLGLLTAGSS